jgi:Asp-tRNA(Asn)/Glu-tRNA(Gln) amidotransferase A subunit family amidase
MSFCDLSLSQLLQDLKTGKLPVKDYIQRSLAHIKSREAEIRALLPEPERRSRLLHEAKTLEAKFLGKAKPALYGLLIGVKDIFNVDALPTQAGSSLPPQEFEGPEASLVSKLKAAGALVLGKTVSTEFAYFTPGPTRNPANLKHSPGGSSSGSAAAIAAGYCHLALGTQTIASVIRPAAYCGICGFKPSSDGSLLQGVFPFAPSMDQIGFFTRNLSDMQEFYTLIHPAKPQPECRPRLIIPRGQFLEQSRGAVRACFDRLCDQLRISGWQICEEDVFHDLNEIIADHKALIAKEFAQVHAPLYRTYHQQYSRASTELYHKGLEVEEDIALLKAKSLALRTRLSADPQCVYLSPATTTPAPWGLCSTGSPLMSLPFTNAGLPAVTIPIGKDHQNLPLGLQMCAAFGQDLCLLKAATELTSIL